MGSYQPQPSTEAAPAYEQSPVERRLAVLAAGSVAARVAKASMAGDSRASIIAGEVYEDLSGQQGK